MKKKLRAEIHPKVWHSLQRSDKWFLGGGKSLIWAPESPLYLNTPGFWDHACILDIPHKPIFTLTFLNNELSQLFPNLSHPRWTPLEYTQSGVLKEANSPTAHNELLQSNYSLPQSNELTLIEKKMHTTGDELVSQITLHNTSNEPFMGWIIVWTLQFCGNPNEPHSRFIHHAEATHEHLFFRFMHTDENGTIRKPYSIRFYSEIPHHSFSLRLSQTGTIGLHEHPPTWKYTPYYENFTSDGLDNESIIRGGEWNNREGRYLYGALAYPIELHPEQTITQHFAAIFHDDEKKSPPYILTNWQKALKNTEFRVAAFWKDYYHDLPQFTCSDPYLETYYWYRWYGLHLNTIDAKKRNLPYPTVFEGINAGWFRHHISYSAQVLMRETAWMHSPAVAQGLLLNMVEHQKIDGSYPGGIPNWEGDTPNNHYLARWGDAVRQLHYIHRDTAFLEKVYPSLERNANYWLKHRDLEKSYVFDIINQSETGQEYMSRYLKADPNADQWGAFRLKGVDATVYAYDLFSFLAEFSPNDTKKHEWQTHATRTAEAIQNQLWDAKDGFFYDCTLPHFDKTTIKTAVGFYPFLLDILDATYTSALTQYLLHPDYFWTPYPVPSTALNEPYSSPNGYWKGERKNCPWNGRSWLMSTSHVCDALAHAAKTIAPDLKPKAVELIHNMIKMCFLDDDLTRPSSYEYYNPIHGKPPYFRGTEDYMHSYMNDLILRYVCGVTLYADKVVIDPFPFPLDYFILNNIRLQNLDMDISYIQSREKGKRLEVKTQHQTYYGDINQPIDLSFSN